MKRKSFFYQFIFFFIFCNCSNQKQAESVVTLTHQTIDLGEDFVGYGGFLAYYQGSVVGMEMSPAMQPFFCIKPNGSRQTLFRFGSKGQGPNEFLMPYSIQYLDHRTIGVFDLTLRTFNEFHIPNEHEDLKVDKKVEIQTPLFRVIKTAFNQYVGLSLEEDMFLLADSTGMPVNTFFKYPYKDEDERQFAFRSHAYQGTLATNPSKNKLVYSSFQGDIIHFYKIEDNNITPIAKIENEYPSYRKRNDYHDGVIVDRNGKVGYIATYATDKFVYALYSGIKTFELKSVNFEGQTLRVFDWTGTLVKEYGLDIPCSYLCTSDDDHKIWAIASNPDITVVLFDLVDIQGDKTYTIQKQKERQSTDHNSNSFIVGTPSIQELRENQPINDNCRKFIIEVVKEGGQDDEIQEATKHIKSQIMKGGDIHIENSEFTIDTLPDNTIKVLMKLK